MNIVKYIVVLGGIVGCVIGGIFIQKHFFDNPFFYSGTLEATRVVVPARLSSQILNFPIRDGDRVSKDQIIADLDDADLRISLRNLKNKYDRAKTLFQHGRFPQSDLESIECEKNAIELKMQWSHVHCPVDGVVLAKYKEAGEWVTQGVGLVSVANIKEIWSFFYVEQEKIARLSLGMPVFGTLPEIPGRVFKGKIIKINSEPEFTPKNIQTRQERTRLVYGIKVRFENEDETLKPGMTIETNFD